MTDLRVAHLRKRYQLPAADADGRARLDRALSRALDDAVLDAALERWGVRDGEEVCVCRLHVVARLPRSASEPRLAAAWSLAVAEALDAALRGGAEVVRYGSRHGALRELVRRAPAGDLTRAWAWRQLGLWTLDDAPAPARIATEVVAALAREPRAAVALLVDAAAAGTLGALVALASTAAWQTLARAALASAGAPIALADAPVAGARDAVPNAGPSPAASAAVDGNDGDDAPLAGAFAAAVRAARAPADPSLVRALAALALLHAGPAAVATGARAAELGGRVARIAARIAGAPRDALDARGDAPRTTRPTTARATPRPPADARCGADDDPSPADLRPRGRTAAAGALFLLHLVRALDLPAIVLATDALRGRTLRWTLHRVAADLLALDDRDPAALAFAGLAPDEPPPNADAPVPNDAEREAVGALGARLAATLRVWLPGTHDGDDRALVARVCRRRGEIVADPAWIEAWLPLDEVDPLVRRAGLDVDPDWCPFIGAVVRFRYV